MYVGSAIDLFKRLRLYFSISYLTYHRNSYINRAPKGRSALPEVPRQGGAFFFNYFIKCTPPGSFFHKGM